MLIPPPRQKPLSFEQYEMYCITVSIDVQKPLQTRARKDTGSLLFWFKANISRSFCPFQRVFQRLSPFVISAAKKSHRPPQKKQNNLTQTVQVRQEHTVSTDNSPPPPVHSSPADLVGIYAAQSQRLHLLSKVTPCTVITRLQLDSSHFSPLRLRRKCRHTGSDYGRVIPWRRPQRCVCIACYARMRQQ